MDPPHEKKKGGGYFRRWKKKEPISSFGLLIFHRTADGEIYFLLQQRRDTFEYMDFIRGMWRQESQLSALFTLMSAEERLRVRNYTFQELWDDLFIIKTSKIYSDLLPRARRKYDVVHSLIPNILDTTRSHTSDPPWGFPKGKKNHYKESEVECAVRETEEETRIDSARIKVYEDCRFSEQFQGTNGKAYATHYYLAEIGNLGLPDRIETPDCIRKTSLSEEAECIMWVSYDDARAYLNHRRRLILRDALAAIDQIEGVISE